MENTVSTHKSIVAGIVYTCLMSAGAAHASDDGAAQHCVFDDYQTVSVTPLVLEQDVGYGSYSSLRGAQLFVIARPGLTSEWLTLSSQRSLAHCGVNASKAHVSVVSAGNGFWIQLRGRDEQEGGALLQWAQGRVAR
jgi:hypothetical protein